MMEAFVYICAAILVASAHSVDGAFYSRVRECPELSRITLPNFNLADNNDNRSIVSTTIYNGDKCVNCDKDGDKLKCLVINENNRRETYTFIFRSNSKYPGAVFNVSAPDGNKYTWVTIAQEKSKECPGNYIAFLYCGWNGGYEYSNIHHVVVTQDFGVTNVSEECLYKIWKKVEKVLCGSYGCLDVYNLPKTKCLK